MELLLPYLTKNYILHLSLDNFKLIKPTKAKQTQVNNTHHTHVLRLQIHRQDIP
jgi:hypothetical protein